MVNETEYTMEEAPNCVKAKIWGCCPYDYECDCDCAIINCVPPPTRFYKLVWDESLQEWVDETTVVVGDTVRFQLKLIYYGEDKEFNVEVTDQLPECLLFANNADPEEDSVSPDNHTIYWDFPIHLYNGDELIIEFDAYANETTECCEGENVAIITLIDCYENEVTYEDNATVNIVQNTPPTPPILQEATSGEVDEVLTFEVKSLDNEGDMVKYYIDWGDGTNSGWIGYYTEGVFQEVTNSWDTAGEYEVRAKAMDSHGEESEDWGNTVTVTITSDGEEPEPGENISIVAIGKGFRKITATIENSGEEEVPVNWSITVEGKLLSSKNTNSSGQEDIGGDEEVTVECQVKLLAFGRIDITVEADAGEYGSDSASATAFQLGPFILLLKMA